MSSALKLTRRTWKSKNLKRLHESGVPYERVNNNAIKCCGYTFDLYSGWWSKGGKQWGESAHYFLKFLKKEGLYDESERTVDS